MLAQPTVSKPSVATRLRIAATPTSGASRSDELVRSAQARFADLGLPLSLWQPWESKIPKKYERNPAKVALGCRLTTSRQSSESRAPTGLQDPKIAPALTPTRQRAVIAITFETEAFRFVGTSG